MNKGERQELATAMKIGGECLAIPDGCCVLEGVGDETDDLDAFVDLLRLLRVMIRYQQFDLEATRRERDQLQQMIDSGGSYNEE